MAAVNDDSDMSEIEWEPREIDARHYKVWDTLYTGGIHKRTKFILCLISMLLLTVSALFAQMATFMTISQIGKNDTVPASGNNDDKKGASSLIWHMGLLLQLVVPAIITFVGRLWKYIHRPILKRNPRELDMADKIFIISREILRAISTAIFVHFLHQLPPLLYPLIFFSIGALQCNQLFKYNRWFQRRQVHERRDPIYLLIFDIFRVMVLFLVPVWFAYLGSNIWHAVELFILTFFVSLFFCSSGENETVATSDQDSKVIWLWKKFVKHFLKKEEPLELTRSLRSIHLITLPFEIVSYGVVGLIWANEFGHFTTWDQYEHAFKLLKNDPFGDGRWWILVGVVAPFLSHCINRTVNKVNMFWKFSAVPLILAPACVAIWLLVVQLVYPNQNYSAKHLLLPCMPLWNTGTKTLYITLWSICLVVMIICQIFSGRHIFKRHHHVLLSDGMLFYSRGYDGVCLLQYLIYNRKVIDANSETPQNSQSSNDLPMIHMCATLYQETQEEMEQLFISIFKTEKYPDSKPEEDATADRPPKYDFDAHIMFDDAIKSSRDSTEDGPPELVVYDYVHTMMGAIQNAASIVYNSTKKLEPPTISITPYGAQMIWETPLKKKKIVVHMKDKTKVRRRKRWSQIMYLYYLLTYKIKLRTNSNMRELKNCSLDQPFPSIFSKEVKQKLNNTFLLTLDGDIDWEPISIQLLLNRLLNDENKAAVCARIKPSGSGLAVWYQKIEYAVQHWFAKVTECVFGCVLCAPGCFSLFRAMALIDDNVLKTYSKIPTSAIDMVKCDQGEDRWLCTLLLSSRSGWYIDYCAASSARANSPSTFTEFLEQRRRWISSSVLNHFDFLHNSKQITSVNRYIHWYFIWLQLLVFISDTIGPAFVIIYMTTSLTYIDYSELTAFIVCAAPVVIELYVCIFHSKKVQLLVTAILSAFVTLLFTMAVATNIFAALNQLLSAPPLTSTSPSPFNHTIKNIVTDTSDEIENYATYVFPVLVAVVIIAGICHPSESKNLLFLPIYIIGTPVTRVIFFIYAACNINDTTWGTRETNKEKTSTGSKKPFILKELAFALREMLWAWIRLKRKQSQDLLRSFDDYKLEAGDGPVTTAAPATQKKHRAETDLLNHSTMEGDTSLRYTTKTKDARIFNVDHEFKWRDTRRDVDRDNWESEVSFWKSAIKNCNLGLSEDTESQQLISNGKMLRKFRNQVVTGFFLVMAVLLAAQYQVMISQHRTGFAVTMHIGKLYMKVDYLTMCLLIIYTLQIAFQIIGFLCHRFQTVLDYLAVTGTTKKRWDSEN